MDSLHESAVHVAGTTEHALVQSKWAARGPGTQLPLITWSKAAQSMASTTPLGHETAWPFMHCADASGVQPASPVAAHATQPTSVAVGKPPHRPAPFEAQSTPMSPPSTHQCRCVPLHSLWHAGPPPAAAPVHTPEAPLVAHV